MAHFVAALFGIAHYAVTPFLSRPFWREFHENNFFALNFSFFFRLFLFGIFQFNNL